MLHPRGNTQCCAFPHTASRLLSGVLLSTRLRKIRGDEIPQMVCIAHKVWEIDVVAQLLADSAPEVRGAEMFKQLIDAKEKGVAKHTLWVLLLVLL